MLSFDITDPPPDVAQVAAERKALAEAKDKALRRFRAIFWSFGALVGLTALAALVTEGTRYQVYALVALSLVIGWGGLLFADAVPFMTLGLGLCFMGYLTVGYLTDAEFLLAALGDILIFFCAFFYVNRAESAMGSIKAAQAGLGPIGMEVCPELLAWCREYPEVANYQASVARQGRRLTAQERIVLANFVDARVREAKRAQLEAERLAACEALQLLGQPS